MGSADYYSHGNPNKICDKCGIKYKASELRQQWDHTWVCDYDFELRQPQDKLKAFPDKQTIDDPRPEAVSGTTYWNGSSEVTSTNSPSTDEFLTTNEVTTNDLGDGNNSICDVVPDDPSCP